MTEPSNRSDHPNGDGQRGFVPPLSPAPTGAERTAVRGGSTAATSGERGWAAEEFAECFRVYAEGVRAALRVRLKNGADVEDCLNRVFERLWSRGAAIPPPARRSWLLVVARNEATACVRREARHSFGLGPAAEAGQRSGAARSGSDGVGDVFESPGGAGGGGRGRVWEELVDDGPPPWQGLLQGEELERLRGATERLSPEQAEVIRCRFIDGLTFQEIADRLGVPLGTALSRARAAILRLKRDLDR